MEKFTDNVHTVMSCDKVFISEAKSQFRRLIAGLLNESTKSAGMNKLIEAPLWGPGIWWF